MLNKSIAALVTAGTLAASIALVGCGGASSTSSAATSASAAATSAATDAASTSAAATSAATEATSAATSAAAPAATSAAAAPATDSYIGEQAAGDIALKDAGLTAADVTEFKVELDLDDAVVHYDVDFKQGTKEFDYDIDAVSGAIITAKSEVDD